ncbi:glycoside hydrolase family 3 C-terminal domain-containing protein [Streptomyces sp. GTA36]
MPTTADSTAFSTAVAAVRVGTSPDEAAEELLERLTPEERLGLLDSDLPFWQGLAAMMADGYNRTPIPMVPGYSRCQGGHALAGVLLGDVDASGRLPYSIPLSEGHLPSFDRDATAITYDKWFGQRLLDRDGHQAAFPRGYGLSYTAFTLADLAVGTPDGDAFTATVTVTNTGSRAGRHVVQLYGLPISAGGDFPPPGSYSVSPPSTSRPARRR